MYKNIIHFSFSFITRNVRMVIERHRGLRCARTHTHWQRQRCGSSVKPLCLYASFYQDRNLPWFIEFSGRPRKFLWLQLPLTGCSWTHLFLACHPCNLRGASAKEQPAFYLPKETCALPVLLSALLLQHVKEIFKSISNNPTHVGYLEEWPLQL